MSRFPKTQHTYVLQFATSHRFSTLTTNAVSLACFVFLSLRPVCSVAFHGHKTFPTFPKKKRTAFPGKVRKRRWDVFEKGKRHKISAKFLVTNSPITQSLGEFFLFWALFFWGGVAFFFVAMGWKYGWKTSQEKAKKTYSSPKRAQSGLKLSARQITTCSVLASWAKALR